MLITPDNTLVFHRTLYAQMLQTITVLKRNDTQQQGTVRALTLYECRQSRITKSGQSIQGDMSTNHTTIWHIPILEMQRTGIDYFNVLDRIVDRKNRYWEPETGQNLDIKLFENHWCLMCVRVDPPAG
jgi:hypothetical protein